MVRFEDRIRVKINFDATDVAKAVAAAQLALSDIDEREFNKSMERVDSRLADLQTRDPDFDIGGDINRSSIERAKEQAEDAAEGIERIKIGGEVWNASITTAVQNAKRKIQSEYESQGEERVEIGAELDISDLEGDLETAEETAEAKIIRIPLRFKVHMRSLGGAMLAAHNAVKAHNLFTRFKIPIRAEVDRASFTTAVTEASNRASKAMAAGKQQAINANRKLTRSAVASQDALDGENRSAQQVAKTMGAGMGSLAKAKHVAAKANTRLGQTADRTHDRLRGELGMSKEVADQLVPMARRSRFAGKSTRALARAADESADKMRASSRVGNMFNDALGKLSVNVGAFTIALRNLATQIPIILGTISAIGSAALGAATALVTATFALVGMFAGGLIAEAERLRDSLAGIETTAEALQEIFSRLKTLFRDALSPIIEVAGASDFFVRILEGFAVIVGMMAEGISQLTEEITFMLDALGGKGVKAFGKTVAASVYAVQTLKDEFVDIMTGLFNATAAVIVFSAEFIDGFTESGSVTKELGSLLGDLARTVQHVFRGAIPILSAFRDILADIVDVLSRLEDSVYKSAIAFAIIVFLINKVAGIAGTIVGILPALAAAFLVARETTDSLGDQIIMLIKQFSGFLLASQSILGGVTKLSTALDRAQMDFLQLGVASLVSAKQLDAAEGQIRSLARAVNIPTKQTNLGFNLDLPIDDVVEDLDGSDQIDKATKSNLARFTELRTRMGRASSKPIDFNIDDMFRGLAGMDKEISRSAAQMNLEKSIMSRFSNLSNRTSGFLGGFTKKFSRLSAIPKIANNTFIGPMFKNIGKFYTKLVASSLSTFSLIASSAIAAFIPVGTLSTLLGGLLGPVLVVVAAGAILLGLLTNMDKVTAALSGSLVALKNIAVTLGSFLLDIFVGAWNLIAGIIEGFIFILKPFIDLFSSVFQTGEDGGGTLANLLGVVEVLGAAFKLLTTALGQVLRVVGAVIGFVVRVALAPLSALIGLLQFAVDQILDFFGIDTGGSPFVSALKMIVEFLTDAVTMVIQLGDKIIGLLNDVMRRANQVSGMFGFDIFRGVGEGEVDLQTGEVTGASGLATTRAEAIEEGKDAGGKLGNIPIPGLNFYQGDKITNNNIDADPDDKAALGRAVKRAIEQANSFERQRLGN